MPSYVAAIDQGTTGTRFMIFDGAAQVVSHAYLEHRQIHPRPGWVEHDPLEIWQRTREVIEAGLVQARLPVSRLAALGLANQRETTILWEKETGRPVHNAIVWQDVRTSEICRHLIDEGLDETVRARTGLRISPYFSGPKIAWLLDNLPGLRARAERGEVLFGNVDTWLLWWLTGGPGKGVHVTDPTNASRTMLMDLRRLQWDPELLRLMKVPEALLPEIRPSSVPTPYGVTVADGPFLGAVPLHGDLGDQQAALLGQVCCRPGQAKNTYGTGNFLLVNTGADAVGSSRLLTSPAAAVQSHPTYCLEGSIAVTGAAIQWLRDNLGVIEDAGQSEALASQVEDSAGVYFVPAFSGLFAPHWDMEARGLIAGLTAYADRRHLVRAALEAICYQTLDVVEAIEADSGLILKSLRVDGGASRNELLMQLQADILGIPVERPVVRETTALGAAYAAGLGAGFFSGLEELARHRRVDRTFTPRWSRQRREAGHLGWRRAVERARGWNAS